MTRQRIILKADDLKVQKNGVLSSGWASFIRYIIRENLKAGIGLIGCSLKVGDRKHFSLLKDFHRSSFFELWNHGYNHLLWGRNLVGEVCSEFRNTSYVYQKSHLLKTQVLAREKLGIVLQAFGAPGNRCDQHTLRVIDEVEDIRVWLCGHQDSKKKVLDRYAPAEHPMLAPNYGWFLSQYDAYADYLVVQVHPNKWGPKQFEQFSRIIRFLKYQNCVFTTPSAYGG